LGRFEEFDGCEFFESAFDDARQIDHDHIVRPLPLGQRGPDCPSQTVETRIGNAKPLGHVGEQLLDVLRIRIDPVHRLHARGPEKSFADGQSPSNHQNAFGREVLRQSDGCDPPRLGAIAQNLMNATPSRNNPAVAVHPIEILCLRRPETACESPAGRCPVPSPLLDNSRDGDVRTQDQGRRHSHQTDRFEPSAFSRARPGGPRGAAARDKSRRQKDRGHARSDAKHDSGSRSSDDPADRYPEISAEDGPTESGHKQAGDRSPRPGNQQRTTENLVQRQNQTRVSARSCKKKNRQILQQEYRNEGQAEGFPRGRPAKAASERRPGGRRERPGSQEGNDPNLAGGEYRQTLPQKQCLGDDPEQTATKCQERMRLHRVLPTTASRNVRMHHE